MKILIELGHAKMTSRSRGPAPNTPSVAYLAKKLMANMFTICPFLHSDPRVMLLMVLEQRLTVDDLLHWYEGLNECDDVSKRPITTILPPEILQPFPTSFLSASCLGAY